MLVPSTNIKAGPRFFTTVLKSIKAGPLSLLLALGSPTSEPVSFKADWRLLCLCAGSLRSHLYPSLPSPILDVEDCGLALMDSSMGTKVPDLGTADWIPGIEFKAWP